MIAKSITLGVLVGVASHAVADFIIVPPPSSPEATPIKHSRSNQPAFVNRDDYTIINKASQPLSEIGAPIASAFKPEVYVYETNLVTLLPSLLPGDLAVYIHDAVTTDKTISFFSEFDESWRQAITRVAVLENISVTVDWNRQVAQVIPNTARYAETTNSERVVSDSSGQRYVIRSIEDDFNVASGSGYLVVDGEVLKFKNPEKQLKGAQ